MGRHEMTWIDMDIYGQTPTEKDITQDDRHGHNMKDMDMLLILLEK